MAFLAQDAPLGPTPGSGATPELTAALLDSVPGYALVIGTDGIMTACNEALRAACSRIIASNVQPVRLHTIIDAEAAEQLLTPEGARGVRATLADHDNASAQAIITWSSRPLHPPGGEALWLVSGITAERENALEEYIVANQWFETAAALSGGLAHDFNNVLAAILGLSEIISLRLPPDSPLQNYTGKIGESVERAKVLVRRFSQFSRKSPGMVDAQPTAMILQDLGKLLIGFLPGSVICDTDLPPETPWCKADRHDLEQIVLNCANYLRARLREENGHIHLSCRGSADGSRVIVELLGSGQGLLGVDHEALFSLSLAPTKTAYESGAGLFTARVLAERHGARLGVIRQDPRTLTFVLQLPAAD